MEISLLEVWEALGGEAPRRQKARCILPDHEDRTPSASVDDNKGLWFCHVCDKGGDALRLIMEVEGIGFREAKRRAEELTGKSYGEVRGSTGGVPGYLVSGGQGNHKGSRKYVPPWLRK